MMAKIICHVKLPLLPRAMKFQQECMKEMVMEVFFSWKGNASHEFIPDGARSTSRGKKRCSSTYERQFT
jgi:hypothetical protein